MANVNAPSGFSPVKSLLGGGFSAQDNLYYIATDGTNTYAIGDVVMSTGTADANGVHGVTKWGGATTTSALPLGIITGFQNPASGNSLVGAPLALEKVYLGLSAGAQYVYVCDDPYAVFEAQFDSTVITTTTISGNAAVTVIADNTATLSAAAPLSKIVLTSPAVTATLPIRILGALQVPNNAVGAYVKVLCKWNYHENGVTGGASSTVVGYLAP